MLKPIQAITRTLCRPLFVLSLLLLAVIFTSATQTFEEWYSKTEFPKQVTFTHRGQAYTLDATGAALRRKWFVKGYAIAHYLEPPIKKGDLEVVIKQAFSDDKAKQMTIFWLHKLSLKLIHEGYHESFKKVLNPQDYTRLEKDIEKFISFMKEEAKPGDLHFMRWLPGGYVELIVNDQKAGSLVSADFAKALWSIWLGPDAVVERQRLVGLDLIQ